MEDRILDSYLKSFVNDFKIEENDDAKCFEHFVNYCMMSKHLPEIFRDDNLMFDKVHTGCGGDYGIDGVAIYINDEILVTSKEQIREAIGSQSFTATFVFVQAKTSNKFDSGDMLKTGNGVRNIFRNQLVKANDYIKKIQKLVDFIYSKSVDFKCEPECVIYYATQGKWVGDPFLQQTIDGIKRDISDLGGFSKVEFIPKDSNGLKTAFKEVSNKIQKRIPMTRCVPFPKIAGVEQAFLGLVNLKDYLNFICDSDGKLQNSLFFDNVRSYLGDNPVNKEIQATILNKDKNVQFPILNNGVTIVAKSLEHPGEEFVVSDFQIVNGCQTSNVLYRYGKEIETDVYIPVKIINTQDAEVINDIIKSTNRQTEVKKEAFESLKPFHKNLQAYFDTYNDADRLYYERRAREYKNYNGVSISSYRVITLASQLYAFVSMFLEEPQSTHRYYGELLKAKGDAVFNDTHIPLAYYSCAYCLTKINYAIKKKLIPDNLKEYRFQFLLMFRYVVCGNKNLRPNSHEMARMCNAMLDVLRDDQKFIKTIKESVKYMEDAIKTQRNKTVDGTPFFRKKEFTLTMKDLFN